MSNYSFIDKLCSVFTSQNLEVKYPLDMTKNLLKSCNITEKLTIDFVYDEWIRCGRIMDSKESLSYSYKKDLMLEFFESKVYQFCKINHRGDVLILTSSGGVKMYKNVFENDIFFKSYFYILAREILPENIRYNREKFTENLYAKMSFLTVDDNSILLSNGVLKDGNFFETNSLTVAPKFYIPHAYDDNVSIEQIKPLMELLNHIASGRKEVVDLLIDMIASSFIPYSNFMSKFGKVTFISGKSGSNGKSTLLNLISEIVGKNNSFTFSIDKLNDDNVLLGINNSLVALDYDSVAAKIDDKSSANLKKLATGDSISARGVYKKKMSTFRSTSKLWIASNNNFKSSDKTKAIVRRILPIDIKEKLAMNSKTYNELFSEQHVSNCRNFFIQRSLTLYSEINTSKFMDNKNSLIESLSELRDLSLNNNNVLSFISDVGLDEIAYWPVSVVRTKYEEWCKESSEPILGLTVYNDTLESELRLKRDTIRTSQLNPNYLSSNKDLFINTSNKIKVWKPME